MANGFIHQSDYYGCGAYALKHALLLLGMPIQIEKSKKLCKTISYGQAFREEILNPKFILDPKGQINKYQSVPGTDEQGLFRGIKKMKCLPVQKNTLSKKETKIFLIECFNLGMPIIAHVNWSQDEEDTGHWLVLAGIYHGKYIVIDSAPFRNDDIITLYTWQEFVERLTWCDDDREYFQFYGIGVKSTNHSAIFQLKKVIPKLLKDEYLREWWGYYLSDILELDRPHGKKAADYFKKSKEIIHSTWYWIGGDLNIALAKQTLEYYRLLCEVYEIKLTDEFLVMFTAEMSTGY